MSTSTSLLYNVYACKLQLISLEECVLLCEKRLGSLRVKDQHIGWNMIHSQMKREVKLLMHVIFVVVRKGSQLTGMSKAHDMDKGMHAKKSGLQILTTLDTSIKCDEGCHFVHNLGPHGYF